MLSNLCNSSLIKNPVSIFKQKHPQSTQICFLVLPDLNVCLTLPEPSTNSPLIGARSTQKI
ncbi:hypothetical protein I7I48_00922 [Histoplasma ohiense]|nr:hypothetical protein I7I48_00922 [Histoplasma ohiense (nom. inval.)]